MADVDMSLVGSQSDEMLSFHIRKEASRSGPRVGDLYVGSRVHVSTPTLVATTSRGVVPHITPDLMQKHTTISVAYVGLEDFLERCRQTVPILNTPHTSASSPLQAYTCLPDRCLSILGAFRVPRLTSPQHNTSSAIAISTSSGFSNLEVQDYDRSTRKLKPDIGVTAVDLVDESTISKKRIEKSADRTHAWLRDTVAENVKLGATTPLFVSIPPLEPEQQSFYLSDLSDEFNSSLSGVCVYAPRTIPAIPASLGKLPVLCLRNTRSPHELLNLIALGADMITVPFVTDTSEAGIALTFSFTPPLDARNAPLGIDMWTAEYSSDVSPLVSSCTCYACTKHHRAYIHHLLQAKEMLAWTLLQIHNFHVIDQFFQQIQTSIEQGTFEADSHTFRAAYESTLPQKTGQGPRIRGYQIRSVGPGESKKNEKKFNRFEEQAMKLEEAESGIATPDPDQDAETLEAQGLGQKTGHV